MTRVEEGGIQGWLYRPEGEARFALGLTHGAGSNCEAPLLKAVAEAFATAGALVLRYDLPYRIARPKGAPAGMQDRDQEGVRNVAAYLRNLAPGVKLIMGGHSYGGRMTSMAGAGDVLMLLSYPLHPPGNPAKARTEHFPKITAPAVFFHGTRDEFGSPAEMKAAMKLLSGPNQLVLIDGAGHGLPPKHAPKIVETLQPYC